MTSEDFTNTAAGDRLLIIEAFIDGERIDPKALSDALADPAGREHLVELLMLRGAVAAMGPHQWNPGRAGTRTRAMKWLAAAAMLILGVSGGYVAGQRVMAASASAEHIEAVVGVDPGVVAPAPTRVIALEPGVNWTDTRGEK